MVVVVVVVVAMGMRRWMGNSLKREEERKGKGLGDDDQQGGGWCKEEGAQDHDEGKEQSIHASTGFRPVTQRLGHVQPQTYPHTPWWDLLPSHKLRRNQSTTNDNNEIHNTRHDLGGGQFSPLVFTHMTFFGLVFCFWVDF